MQVQAGRIRDGEVTDEIGLVPENYLELVERGDGDSEDEGSGWGEDPEREADGGGLDAEEAGGDRGDDVDANSPTTPRVDLDGLHLTAAPDRSV